ncbi:unnamed protein product [Linum tenue]|uniref:BED-type domain-containing protein n=1 Tax=Linum tenue TaxID=586396 RepID=A0AAV0LCD6_9ROSI|nr:unnamed protein product [Linum tenue]CAI0432140.1 unnamed protein product [Linum tenue]
MKARCKYCKKPLGGETSNEILNLRNHIKSCIQRRIHDGTRKILGLKSLLLSTILMYVGRNFVP